MHLRKLRLAAMTGIVAIALAACGGGSSTTTSSTPAAGSSAADAAAGEATTAAADESAAPAGSTAGALTIWTGAQDAKVMQEQGDRFTAESGIPVKVETIASDVQTQFVTASQAGTGPDLITGAHDWIGNLVQNGAIDPVPMTDAKQAEFLPKSIEGATFNGQIYGVPFAIENVALIRNTALVPDAPTTIEEMVTIGEQLKAEGKTTEVLALPVGAEGDAYHMYPFFTSGGGTVFGQTADGAYDPKQLELDTPEAIAAMTKIGALGETGQNVLKRSIGNDNALTVFTDGKAPFFVTGPWNIPKIQASGIEYGISPVPGFEGEADPTPFVGVQLMYVASKGKNLAVAQEFATNFFPTVEVATALFEANPRPPALKAVYEEVAATNADVKAFQEAGANGQAMPSITAMTATFAPWGKAIAAVVGGADPASTMTDTAAAINSAIGN